MTSINMQCTSYFPYAPASGSDCSAASAYATAILCNNPVTTCLSQTSTTCKASAQDSTYTNSDCSPIPLAASGGIIAPPSLTISLDDTFSFALVSTFASETCQGQPASGGVFALQQCNPSPFNDGTWGVIYSDFAKNLYYDGYADTTCIKAMPSKTGIPLTKSGSTCVNKLSASLFRDRGYKTSFYYSDNCSTVNRIVQTAIVGSCTQQTTCSQSQPSMVFHKTVSCQNSASEYNLENEAKTVFGSKPFAIVDSYGDKDCQTVAPVWKGAVLLDECYASAAEGSTIYAQAANGSLVYSHYASLGCSGELKARTSYSSTGACNDFGKAVIFTKTAVSTTKSSGGFAMSFHLIASCLLSFVIEMF
ncbi:hypothetical protein BDR26DRAFT_939061 [Obelidium mucronatum]|nr:hypothetical protein BDR26DRAFT_939061 [Obelidium mucronatum]